MSNPFLETLMLLAKIYYCLRPKSQPNTLVYMPWTLVECRSCDFLKQVLYDVMKSVHCLIVMVERDDFLSYALLVVCPCFFPVVACSLGCMKQDT